MCDENNGIIRLPDTTVFEHSPNHFEIPTGFYRCSWSIMSEVTGYIIFELLQFDGPAHGELVVSAGVGQDPALAESTIFTTDIPSWGGIAFIGNRTSTAWLTVRSSQFLPFVFDWPQSFVQIGIFQQDQSK